MCVCVLLIEKELKQFIEKPLTEVLTAEDDETEHPQIVLNEKKCISLLVQIIHDNQLEYVREKDTTEELFYPLYTIFERKCLATQVLMRK